MRWKRRCHFSIYWAGYQWLLFYNSSGCSDPPTADHAWRVYLVHQQGRLNS